VHFFHAKHSITSYHLPPLIVEKNKKTLLLHTNQTPSANKIPHTNSIYMRLNNRCQRS